MSQIMRHHNKNFICFWLVVEEVLNLSFWDFHELSVPTYYFLLGGGGGVECI